MILQQLYADAGTLLGEDMPPPMYDTKPVRRIIDLTADGTLIGEIVSLGGDKQNKRGQPRMVPYISRTSGVRPILLADTPAYVLGVSPDDKRAAEKHAAFKALVHQCAEVTGDPSVHAVDAFLTTWDPATGTVPADLSPGDLITFQVAGKPVADIEKVRQFWAKSARVDDGAGGESQCLVTGLRGPVEKSLPGTIKGVPGGQMSGIALVSANEDAFESYGLERAQTSPISREAAERFTKALNHLIATRDNHITIGGLVYVFWTRNGDSGGVFGFLDNPDPNEVRDLLRSHHSGERKHLFVEPEEFYAFALSASAARAVTRDWLHTTVGEVKERLKTWFEAHEMVAPDGSETRFYKVYNLAASAYRDARKEMDTHAAQGLFRSALHGEPVPQTLLAKAVLRCRAEQRVTAPRAALIKAALVMKSPPFSSEEAQRMTTLDMERQDAPYLCGRLLAELAEVQRVAVGPINTTLIDRYFGAASTTPATVFGVLLSQANKAHLPKIRKTRRGAYAALQERLEQIMAPMTGFPKTLTLQEQALFALGFYHQRAYDRAQMAEAKARKEQGKATAKDANLAELADIDTTLNSGE